MLALNKHVSVSFSLFERKQRTNNLFVSQRFDDIKVNPSWYIFDDTGWTRQIHCIQCMPYWHVYSLEYNHLLLSLIIFHRWKIRTVTRTGCRSLMRRRRKRCSGGCWGGPLGCIPTSSCFRTTLVFPRMKSFTHGRISQGRWWHGRRLVTKRCHHGQGGPS